MGKIQRLSAAKIGTRALRGSTRITAQTVSAKSTRKQPSSGLVKPKRRLAQGKVVETRTTAMLKKQAVAARALAKEFCIKEDPEEIAAIIRSWEADG